MKKILCLAIVLILATTVVAPAEAQLADKADRVGTAVGKAGYPIMSLLFLNPIMMRIVQPIGVLVVSLLPASLDLPVMALVRSLQIFRITSLMVLVMRVVFRVLTPLGGLLPAIAPVVDAILPPILGFANGIAPLLAPLAIWIAPILAPLEVLTPLIAPLMGTLLPMMMPMLLPLVGSIGIGPIFGMLFGAHGIIVPVLGIVKALLLGIE